DSLQHSNPLWHLFGPHWGPSGSQTCVVHMPPMGEQMEQESLQQYSPAPQMLAPHCSPPGTGVHSALPSTTSHVVPPSQVTELQGSAPSGTGFARAEAAK